MPLEKATAIVLRSTDWSETSRISTLWTREFGKVRVIAKGGRRLKSNFESALDLLTVCDIVLIRKTSGSLDLLTEARVLERFSTLRADLAALYAGYYLAELLEAFTQEYDPHTLLFDEALVTLRGLGGQDTPTAIWLARFELVLLRELGYGPTLMVCADCGADLPQDGLAFSAAGGGVLCSACQPKYRQRRPMMSETLSALRLLSSAGTEWQRVKNPDVRRDVRLNLNDTITYLLGHPPRLLPYLGS